MGGRFSATQIPKGPIHLNRLALGTVQFGLPYGIANREGQVSLAEAKFMLHLAKASGVNTIDTAIAYGNSEACLGKLGMQGLNVVTKLPALPENCIDVHSWVHKQVYASLTLLGVTKIFGLLLHRPDQLLTSNGAKLYQSLKELKKNGLVQKTGISIYSPSELDELIPKYNFDLVQAPLNLIDQRFFRSGWLHRLKQDGVEIHTRSAFLQGLLLMSRTDIPSKFLPWENLWLKWHSWLANHGISALQASIAFPLSFTEIDRIVVGANSVRQLSEIMSATKWPSNINLPDLKCHDEILINPSKWNLL